MECPLCHAINRNSATFCNACGTRLDMVAARRQAGLAEPCPNCRHAPPRGAHFCPECGHLLKEPETPPHLRAIQRAVASAQAAHDSRPVSTDGLPGWLKASLEAGPVEAQAGNTADGAPQGKGRHAPATPRKPAAPIGNRSAAGPDRQAKDAPAAEPSPAPANDAASPAADTTPAPKAAAARAVTPQGPALSLSDILSGKLLSAIAGAGTAAGAASAGALPADAGEPALPTTQTPAAAGNGEHAGPMPAEAPDASPADAAQAGEDAIPAAPLTTAEAAPTEPEAAVSSLPDAADAHPETGDTSAQAEAVAPACEALAPLPVDTATASEAVAAPVVAVAALDEPPSATDGSAADTSADTSADAGAAEVSAASAATEPTAHADAGTAHADAAPAAASAPADIRSEPDAQPADSLVEATAAAMPAVHPDATEPVGDARTDDPPADDAQPATFEAHAGEIEARPVPAPAVADHPIVLLDGPEWRSEFHPEPHAGSPYDLAPDPAPTPPRADEPQPLRALLAAGALGEDAFTEPGRDDLTVRRAAREKRRTRWIAGSLAVAAAGLMAVFLVTLKPFGQSAERAPQATQRIQTAPQPREQLAAHDASKSATVAAQSAAANPSAQPAAPTRGATGRNDTLPPQVAAAAELAAVELAATAKAEEEVRDLEQKALAEQRRREARRNSRREAPPQYVMAAPAVVEEAPVREVARPAPPLEPCAGLTGLGAQQCRQCGKEAGSRKSVCEDNVRHFFCNGRWGTRPECPAQVGTATF